MGRLRTCCWVSRRGDGVAKGSRPGPATCTLPPTWAGTAGSRQTARTCAHTHTHTRRHTWKWMPHPRHTCTPAHARTRTHTHTHGGVPGNGCPTLDTHMHGRTRTHTHAHARQAHLEADGRGLVAVHGDGRKAVQGLEYLAVEGVPGHRGKLLGDRRLGAGADFLAVEPGARRSRPEWGLGEQRGAQQGPGDASLQRGGAPRADLRPQPSGTLPWPCLLP